MHVAFNAYFWNRPDTGSGQYLRQLVYYLNRYVSDLEITLIYPQTTPDDTPSDVPPSVKVELAPMRAGHVGKVLFEQRTFPQLCRKLGVTLAHVPYWGSPLSNSVPTVVTIHDVTTLLMREYRRTWQSRLYTALVTASARAANHVITDSQASQSDIITHLNLPAEKVTPIYLGIGSEFSPTENLIMDMAVQRKYDLPDDYVLYLGGYTFHKNVDTLLYAYTFVATALGEDFPLVLAGKKPDKVTETFIDYDDYIARLNLSDSVRWIGFVDEEDKPALYRNASSFVFPSKYEGFGFPPLEAMACGTPVVTTDASSLPEIVGDAAFTVDPEDGRGMAGAIIATVIQENLAADMAARGQARAAEFSWETTATETVLIYDRIANG